MRFFKGEPLLLKVWRDRERRKRFLLISLGIGLVVAVTMVISGIPFSTNPNFCGQSCHATNPEYQSWTRSAHAEVACHFCHMDNTYVGLHVERLTTSIKRAILVNTGNFDKPLNSDDHYGKQLPADACLRCHSPWTREFTGQRGIKVTSAMHVKHLDAGLQCTTCHNRIAHVDAEKYEPLKSWKPGFEYKDFMTMREGCWRCHSDDPKYKDQETLNIVAKSGKNPPTSCIACHDQKWNLKPIDGEYDHNDAKGVPWSDGARRHGKVASKDVSACLACHPRTPEDAVASRSKLPNCTGSCHPRVSKPTSHNDQWVKQPPHNHSIKAREGKDTCLVCHQEDFCDNCHQTRMPHEVDWRSNHGAEAALTAKTDNDSSLTCDKCHQPEPTENRAPSCEKCHKAAVYPHPKPWAPQHGKIARTGGVDVCETCHVREAFCNKCHGGVEMPHEATWLGDHRKFVKDNAVDACWTCHQKGQCEKCHSAHIIHNRHTDFDFTKPFSEKGH